MSGPRKMTAAEYLAARGWIYTGTTERDQVRCYADPAHQEHDAIGEDTALVLQRARDAEEERKAWVAFAACAAPALMRLGGKFTAPDDSPIGFDEAVARMADGMLDAYRARFAVEASS